MIVLIGALGFTPLITAFVYIRNAFRAFETAALLNDHGLLVRSFILASIISFAVPFTVNTEVDYMINEIVSGDAATAQREARKLRYIAPIACFDKLALRYHEATDDERHSLRMQTIAKIYQDLADVPIENNRRTLAD